MGEFTVVSWNCVDGEQLENEQLEVVAVKKLIFKEAKAVVGLEVFMQFRKKNWSGNVISIHSDQKSAKSKYQELLDAIAPAPLQDQVVDSPRKRKKKVQKDYILTTESSDEENVDPKAVTAAPGALSTPPITQTPSGTKNFKKIKKPRVESKQKDKISAKKASDDLIAAILTPHNKVTSVSITDSGSSSCDDDDYFQVPPPLTSTPVHPRFGAKSPKCTNKKCIEVKENLKKELEELKKKYNKLEEKYESVQESSSTPTECVITPFGNITQESAISKGLAELAYGVWCCPVKAKAAISSCKSRTAIACAILDVFYPKEKLLGKRLVDLDSVLISAVVDFSLVAKLNKEGKPCTAGIIKQALRTKCNQLVFKQQRPNYHKDNYARIKVKNSTL